MASTSRIWLVPMPKATAPKAPWVEVCESPQTMVMPGWVRPSSGPITWTMPCLPLPRLNNSIPLRFTLSSSAVNMASAMPSARGRTESRVGTI